MNDFFSQLRDPLTRDRLMSANNTLINEKTGQTYPLIDGIPRLTVASDLKQDNLKFQKMYDWMSYGYDLAEKLSDRFRFNHSISAARHDLMNRVALKKGDRALYVSIGTGRDLAYLNERVPLAGLEVWGIDISFGMLKKCQKNLQKTSYVAHLAQAAAEHLPFSDNSFDAVFHVGGINFFNDRKQALSEMIRVAKTGTTLLVADETQGFVDEQYKKSALTKEYFQNSSQSVAPPLDLLPSTIGDVHLEYLWNNKFYCLTFRKK